MLQRQCCLNFLYRHKMPLLCYNVNIVCSSYFVIKRHCCATTSILFIFYIVIKRRCHATTSILSVLPYFVIKRRCCATTSILSVLSISSWNAVVMQQRQYCLYFLFRHKTPLFCYNVNIVCSFYIVIKRRCYATTSMLFVLLISSWNAVAVLQRQYCLF